MANQGKFPVPVGTRHSFGIELEFLVAYLSRGRRDPHEEISNLLPRPTYVTGPGWRAATDILAFIRRTMMGHGISVAPPSYFPISQGTLGAIDGSKYGDTPARLYNLDKWSVGLDSSVEATENEDDGYHWQAIEIRSPALWASEESFAEIRYVVNLLKTYLRIRVNETCGFHVHVGNGINFFPAGNLRRMGAFLFAADPMLARLHPPSRRLNSYCLSIRDSSRAANPQFTASNANAQVRRMATFVEELQRRTINALPMLAWEDTTVEEGEYGGREGWEEYARWRTEVGPFIYLSQDPDEVPTVADEDPANVDEEGEAQPPEDLLLEQPRPEDEEQEEEPDEGGGAYNRRLLEFMTTSFFLDQCEATYGDRNPYILETDEQLFLAAKAICQNFYHHNDIGLLDDTQTYKVFSTVGRMLERLQTVWRWHDPELSPEDIAEYGPQARWYLDGVKLGRSLDHPRPQGYNQLNAPNIIGHFERLATLVELNTSDEAGSEAQSGSGSGSGSGSEDEGGVLREDYDRARRTNTGLENFLSTLKAWAESLPMGSPVPMTQHPQVVLSSWYRIPSDFPVDVLDAMVEEDKKRQREAEIQRKEDQRRQEEELIRQGMLRSDQHLLFLPNYTASPGEMSDSERPAGPTSWTSSPPDSGGDFNPTAWQALVNMNNEGPRSDASSPFHGQTMSEIQQQGGSPQSDASSPFHDQTMSEIEAQREDHQDEASVPPASLVPGHWAPPAATQGQDASLLHEDQEGEPNDDGSQANAFIFPLLTAEGGNPPPSPSFPSSPSWETVDESPSPSPASSPPAPAPAPAPQSLRPNPASLPASVAEEVHQDLEAEHLEHINSPAAQATVQKKTDTRRGIAQILACESGAAVGFLLSHPRYADDDEDDEEEADDDDDEEEADDEDDEEEADDEDDEEEAEEGSGNGNGSGNATGNATSSDPSTVLGHIPRLNYNFANSYHPTELISRDADAEGYGVYGQLNRRTVEFREAAGTLDDDFIVLWARICAGIADFSCKTGPLHYLRVLERIIEWEEIVRRGDEEEAVRWDVYELLDDMGLFVEAELLWRRERTYGPP